MDENPFTPPQSDLEVEVQPTEGPLMPWEDRASYPLLWDRTLETVKVLLRPSEAGARLGSTGSILPSLTFLALVGMPLAWISQFAVGLYGSARAMQDIFKLFGIPAPAAPNPSMEPLQRLMQVLPAVFFPITMVISLAIWGLLVHGGLWLTRALQPGRGMEATFRTMIYSSSLMLLGSCLFNVWVFLPPLPGLIVLCVSTLLWVAFAFYQGILLAKAHETQVWRGILGLFAPWILFVCCCGGLVGVIAAIIAATR